MLGIVASKIWETLDVDERGALFTNFNDLLQIQDKVLFEIKLQVKQYSKFLGVLGHPAFYPCRF